MKLICPKCKGMKKFYVGKPVSRKCGDHPSVNLIHVDNEIDIPADPVEDDRKEAEETDTTSRPEEETFLKSAIAVLPEFGVDVLRNMARDLKVKNWWIRGRENLLAKIEEALRAEHAAK